MHVRELCIVTEHCAHFLLSSFSFRPRSWWPTGVVYVWFCVHRKPPLYKSRFTSVSLTSCSFRLRNVPRVIKISNSMCSFFYSYSPVVIRHRRRYGIDTRLFGGSRCTRDTTGTRGFIWLMYSLETHGCPVETTHVCVRFPRYLYDREHVTVNIIEQMTFTGHGLRVNWASTI